MANTEAVNGKPTWEKESTDASVYLRQLVPQTERLLRGLHAAAARHTDPARQVALPVLVEAARACAPDAFPADLGVLADALLERVAEQPEYGVALAALAAVMFRRGRAGDGRALQHMAERWDGGKASLPLSGVVLALQACTSAASVIRQCALQEAIATLSHCPDGKQCGELARLQAPLAVGAAVVGDGHGTVVWFRALLRNCDIGDVNTAAGDLALIGTIGQRRSQMCASALRSPASRQDDRALDAISSTGNALLTELMHRALHAGQWQLAAAAALAADATDGGAALWQFREALDAHLEVAGLDGIEWAMAAAGLDVAQHALLPLLVRWATQPDAPVERIAHILEALPPPQTPADREAASRAAAQLWPLPRLRLPVARWQLRAASDLTWLTTEHILSDWQAAPFLLHAAARGHTAEIDGQRIVEAALRQRPLSLGTVQAIAVLLQSHTAAIRLDDDDDDWAALHIAEAAIACWTLPVSTDAEVVALQTALAAVLRSRYLTGNATVAAAIAQGIDRSLHACTDWSRLLHALAVVVRAAPPELSAIALAALLERYASAPPASDCSDAAHHALLQAAAPRSIRRLVSERSRQVLPLLAPRLVETPAEARALADLLPTASLSALYAWVYRASWSFLVIRQEADTLERLAERAQRPTLAAEEQADAIADCLLVRQRRARQQALALAEQILRAPAPSIALGRRARVLERLVLELGGHRGASARTALRWLADAAGAASVSELLAADLLRVMDALNKCIFCQGNLEAVRALGALFQEVRPQLHLFVPKVLATLKNALDVPAAAIRTAVVDAWQALVDSLGLERLGPHLGIVAAIVVPHAREQPRLARILRRVLHDCRTSPQRRYLEEVFWPVMERAESTDDDTIVHDLSRDDLTAVRALLQREAQSRTVVEELRRIGQYGLLHPSRAVRLLALGELHALLRTARRQLHYDVARRQDPHTVHELLLRGLMACAADADGACRRLTLACLAEVGAVDPARLPYALGSTASAVSPTDAAIALDGDEPMVVRLLLQCLIPALRRVESSSSRRLQNLVGYAVQETLRAAGCSESESEDGECGARRSVWRMLPEHARQTVRPFLQSRYAVQPAADARSEDDVVVYTAGMPAGAWLCAFTTYLVDRMTEWAMTTSSTTPAGGSDSEVVDEPRRSTQQRRYRVLRACRGVARHDRATAAYLLPYAMQQLLDGARDGDEQTTAAESPPFAPRTAAAIGMLRDNLLAVFRSDAVEAVQAAFVALDQLEQWRDARWIACNAPERAAAAHERAALATAAAQKPTEALPVNGLLQCLPAEVLASAAIRCRAYHRALFLLDAQPPRDTDWRMRQVIYQQLGERDAMRALSGMRDAAAVPCGHHSVADAVEASIFAAEAHGAYEEALAGHEQRLAADGHCAAHHTGYLACLQSLGLHETALSHAASHADLEGVRELGIEAAVRLERWEAVAALCAPSVSGAFEAHLGRAVLAARTADATAFARAAGAARDSLGPAVAAASFESYGQCYPALVRLHALSELGEVALDNVSDGRSPWRSLLNELDTRLECVAPTLEAREPILALRRVALRMRGQPEAADAATLALARLARKSGNETAAAVHLRLLRSSGSAPIVRAQAQLEQAKVYRARGDRYRATQLLQQVRAACRALGTDDDDAESLTAVAELHSRVWLLRGRWMQEDRAAAPRTIIECYREALTHKPQWEKAHVMLARFYDTLWQDGRAAGEHLAAATDDDHVDAAGYASWALEHYSRSLRYGCKYVFQSLPRIISLWLDSGNDVEAGRAATANALSGGRPQRPLDPATTSTTTIDPLHVLERVRLHLPLCVWFTVMPQLLSRLPGHPSAAVREQLCGLLADLLSVYPTTALWSVLPLAHSRDAVRAQAGQAVVAEARRRGDAQLGAVLDFGMQLIGELARVCLQSPPPTSRAASKPPLRASTHLTALRALLRSVAGERCKASVVVPYQEYLRLRLPLHSSRQPESTSGVEEEGLPLDAPTLMDVDEDIVVMNSLMKPKRIGLVGSDGRVYPFLFKREDAGDMRKDARLMDLLTVVNWLLRKAPEARQRALALRTYAVLPLNEECGILEWVPQLVPLRAAVSALHKALGHRTGSAEIRAAYESVAKENNAPDAKVRFFRDWLLPRFPPVLRHFYAAHFGRAAHGCSAPSAATAATRWQSARTAWARSCGLWSALGYVVGLGDRHGENVLLHAGTGECVHVDFACLFDKGLSLRVPEVVPFRLTQNMVDAMGPVAYAGTFARAMQVTLEVLRSHRDTLLSVLETFLHDPLVDWTVAPSGSKSRRADTTRDREGVRVSHRVRNPQAMRMLRTVDRKVQGLHGAHSGMALSVAGDVDRLIADATDEQHLARMYIWWLPHV
ncbi:hypothetical protein CDCA_CDCA09G2602 [Cyanidium caldarium]|uniref:non-specific serine/threonine protein kinase n=1 Tax=Cyanidium caldarium TaxID=2771 RepID=A0AAV9IW80_CYACA|nr:hypothetical protein CDCA_CDCA09G2602 [Cyanidium caldarium]